MFLRLKFLLLAAIAFISCSCLFSAEFNALIFIKNPNLPEPVSFAISQVKESCAKNNIEFSESDSLESCPENSIVLRVAYTKSDSELQIKNNELQPLKFEQDESYAIRVEKTGSSMSVWVLSTNLTGAMYGVLDIAECIDLADFSSLANCDQKPYIANRGIKFNIPLDLRNPSYTDISDSGQQNIAEMWDFDFWKRQFDAMAKNRYNVISLWSLNPFPSMVKVPEYPDIALDDVWKTTHKLTKRGNNTGSDFLQPEYLENYEVIKKISIDEKIEYWRKVMAYARSRGIRTYIFTWNIFTHGMFGKYGISDHRDNVETQKYFRAAVREAILTYPDLAGIGITAGENMRNIRKKGVISQEQWLWETYGKGINDALAKEPERDFVLIHRLHMTSMEGIKKIFEGLKCPLQVSYKYSVAHMYSIVNPRFINPVLPHLSNENQSWLTLRNDDFYALRWGNENYAREYVKNIPGISDNKIVGFYMGSDGYCLGKDFLGTYEDNNRPLNIEKQWYAYMLWGRLSYNPDLPSKIFDGALKHRYPNMNFDALKSAWYSSSMIFPWATRQIWGDIDLKWWPEGCRRVGKFISVKNVVEMPPINGSNIIPMLDWAENPKEKKGKITPLEVADTLEKYSKMTEQSLKEFNTNYVDSWDESSQLLSDIKLFSLLGFYYSHKIRAAAYISLYNFNGNEDDKAKALANIKNAYDYWLEYSSLYNKRYKPALYNRLGYVDMMESRKDAERDIDIVKNWKVGEVDKKNLKKK